VKVEEGQLVVRMEGTERQGMGFEGGLDGELEGKVV